MNKPLIQLRECPLCPPHKNERTNLWTLGVFIDDLSWNCFRCTSKGNWSSFVKIFNRYGTQCDDVLNEYDGIIDDEYLESDESEIQSITRSEVICENEINEQNELLFYEQPLLHRLIKQRHLSAKSFKDYKVGMKYKFFPNFGHKQQCITFPMYQYKNNEFVATKYKIRCVSNNIKQFAQYPVLNEVGLFGFGLHEMGKKKVVITEGEYDAMAIYHASGYRVKPISLPLGANEIPNVLLKQLLDFYDEFVLFLDWDDAGQRNANLLKERIESNGIKRVNVQIVQKNESLEQKIKDANDILIKYGDFGLDLMNEIFEKYDI